MKLHGPFSIFRVQLSGGCRNTRSNEPIYFWPRFHSHSTFFTIDFSYISITSHVECRAHPGNVKNCWWWGQLWAQFTFYRDLFHDHPAHQCNSDNLTTSKIIFTDSWRIITDSNITIFLVKQYVSFSIDMVAQYVIRRLQHIWGIGSLKNLTFSQVFQTNSHEKSLNCSWKLL